MNMHELREKIKGCGFSQAQICRQSGIPQPTLSRFMAGREILGSHILVLLSFLSKIASATPSASPENKGAHHAR